MGSFYMAMHETGEMRQTSVRGWRASRRVRKRTPLRGEPTTGAPTRAQGTRDLQALSIAEADRQLCDGTGGG